MNDGALAKAIFRMMVLREGIVLVSRSHDETCRCDTCLAAQGDYEAFVLVVERLEDLNERGAALSDGPS